MIPKSSYLISGLALAAVMIAVLPAAGIGSPTKAAPVIQINRAAKGDRFVEPQITVRKIPTRVAPKPVSKEEAVKPKIMDGCEPAFSPVTVPALAHIAGRCIG